MDRNLSTVEESAGTVFSALRIGDWARAVGRPVPSPLPTNDASDPFWSSEFFDICFDPWDVDASDAGLPYHYTKGKVAPPCSRFPAEARCQDWNVQLDGEWNPLLHGPTRSVRGDTRYGKQQLFNFVDGHAKAMPFAATYKTPTDNLWSVTKG